MFADAHDESCPGIQLALVLAARLWPWFGVACLGSERLAAVDAGDAWCGAAAGRAWGDHLK